MTQSNAASDYARKLAAAHAQAQAAGVKRKDYDSWADRALRKLGFRAPPTLYVPLGWLGFWLGVYFAVGSYFLVSNDSSPIVVRVTISIICGVFFGLFMAVISRRNRRKYRLTPWDQL